MTNPLIAMGVRAPDAGRAVSTGLSNAASFNQLREFNATRGDREQMRADDAQLRGQGIDLNQSKLDALEEDRDFNSVLVTSIGLESILGNEPTAENVGRAVDYLDKNIQNIVSRGGDARHSQEALDYLQAGDISGVMQGINMLKAQAVATGKLQAPSDGSFTLGQGQARFDGAGNEVASVEPGGNPILEQIAAIQGQLAIQSQKDSISQNRDKAAREAREAEIAENERLSVEAKGQAQSRSLVNLSREILQDRDGIHSMSGLTDALPTVRPSTKTFDKKLERLLSSLTLENTDLLTGILSDTDIKLLQDSAAAIARGGEFEGNQREILRIVNTLESAAGMELTQLETSQPTGQARRQRRRSGDYRDMSDDEILNFGAPNGVE